MSHYSVLAIGFNSKDDFESAMEVYDENRTVAPYVSHTKEEIMSDAFRSRFSEETINMTPEEFYEWYSKGETLDEKGNIITTYNPESRWDYYSIEKEMTVSELKKLCSEKKKKALENFDEQLYRLQYRAIVNGTDEDKEKLQEYIKNRIDYFYLMWGIAIDTFKEAYPSEDEYIAHQEKVCGFSTYAALTPTGWNEPGKCGWWGLSSATASSEKLFEEGFYENFIEPFPDDAIAYIIDCHI